MPTYHVAAHEKRHYNKHHAQRAAHALNQSNALFVKAAAPAAQASEKESGVPASITLAQACIESGWGQHHIGKANNYFGIKAPLIGRKRSIGAIATGFVESKTPEYDKHHKIYYIVDYFRAYKSMEDSFRDHGLWVRDNKHYAGAVDKYKNSGDADAFAQMLQHGGYAGQHNVVYAGAIINMMRRHKFYQYNAVKPKGAVK